ncbi:putative endonuclease [Polaromonas sp. OV174]|uniref:YraN family protein n=1 Tax=Polaromonas sp. OV174 TaxID=1855300 RepID=UPI0008E1AE30|nr:YraN family protein [Polaromonas sp. OV174]SFC07681.1 putative endonuclease [Polaromonas sp. OV174]
MWFSRKQFAHSPSNGVEKGASDGAQALPKQVTTKSRGDAAESVALAYLLRAGLKLLEANYRTPGRGGGEIDLVMRAADGTLVFVEVRQRTAASHGGAAASISRVKQQRIIFAARHYLLRFASPPPCRFDVVLLQGLLPGAAPANAGDGQIEWLQAAFDAS